MAGETRRVGVEIEFAGLEAHAAADALAEALGGEVRYSGTHVAVIEKSRIGRLKLELDTRYAKPAPKPDIVDRALDELALRQTAADLLSYVVPVELITEPLDPDQLAALDDGVDALRKAGALGTRSGALNAFGMHLNVALVPETAARAIAVATAYAVMEPWLRRRLDPDLSRRATPFVDPYPAGYVQELADAAQMQRLPELPRFLALYAEWNPTRNRGLDLWPLLGHLDLERAEEALGHPVKNPRPAFHYRLPDSRVDDPAWSPRDELAHWDRIERVADDPVRLAAAAGAWSAYQRWDGKRRVYEGAIDGLAA